MGSSNQPGQVVALNALRHDEREARRAEAWVLRLEGYRPRQIAEKLKVSTGTVTDYFQETLAEIKSSSRESADIWRQIELDRLDDLIATWTPVSRDSSHPQAAQGAALIIRAVEAQTRLLGLIEHALRQPSDNGPAVPVEDMLARSPALRRAMRMQLDRADRLAESVDVDSTVVHKGDHS